MEKSERFSFWQYVAFFTLPALTYFSLSGLIAFGFMSRLSPWLAVPLGLLLGAVILAAWIAGQGGTSTVVELNIVCLIFLILLGILVPVFIKLGHYRRHRHHKAAPHRIAPSITKP